LKYWKTIQTSRSHFKEYFTRCLAQQPGQWLVGRVFGPLGAAAGSIGGAVYGYVTVSDYESMIVVLRGMSDENKRQLVARIKQLIGSIAVEVVTAYLNMQTNCDKLAKLLQDFLREKADTN
jgi:hypothetical protein